MPSDNTDAQDLYVTLPPLLIFLLICIGVFCSLINNLFVKSEFEPSRCNKCLSTSSVGFYLIAVSMLVSLLILTYRGDVKNVFVYEILDICPRLTMELANNLYYSFMIEKIQMVHTKEYKSQISQKCICSIKLAVIINVSLSLLKSVSFIIAQLNYTNFVIMFAFSSFVQILLRIGIEFGFIASSVNGNFNIQKYYYIINPQRYQQYGWKDQDRIHEILYKLTKCILVCVISMYVNIVYSICAVIYYALWIYDPYQITIAFDIILMNVVILDNVTYVLAIYFIHPFSVNCYRCCCLSAHNTVYNIIENKFNQQISEGRSFVRDGNEEEADNDNGCCFCCIKSRPLYNNVNNKSLQLALLIDDN